MLIKFWQRLEYPTILSNQIHRWLSYQFKIILVRDWKRQSMLKPKAKEDSEFKVWAIISSYRPILEACKSNHTIATYQLFVNSIASHKESMMTFLLLLSFLNPFQNHLASMPPKILLNSCGALLTLSTILSRINSAIWTLLMIQIKRDMSPILSKFRV